MSCHFDEGIQMASARLSREVKSSTFVQPKNFTYILGEWTVPKQDYQPADLVEASLVEVAACVNYDTSSTNNVRITFNLYKPKENYGWATSVSNLCISAAVGENGEPTLTSINQEYVDMEPQTKKVIQRFFYLKANPQATDGKLHFRLVDNGQSEKGGLILTGATIDVFSP